MKKIVLLSCGSKKLDSRIEVKAKDLYISPLFKYSLNFARAMNPDETFILSAKHGLLNLEKEIAPYDQSLNNLSCIKRKSWASAVVKSLEQVSDLKRDEFIFLAGKTYREYLIPRITHYNVPLENLGIGEQLHYLKGVCLNC